MASSALYLTLSTAASLATELQQRFAAYRRFTDVHQKVAVHRGLLALAAMDVVDADEVVACSGQ